MPRAIDSPVQVQPGLGLLSPGASFGPYEMPDHAAFEGVEYVAESCGVVRLYPGVCDTTPPTKNFPEGVGEFVEAVPFIVYASEICGIAGRSVDEAASRVRRKLAMREQWGVERALIGGDVGQPGILDSLALVPVAGAPTTVAQALSLLEQHAAENYGLPVTIHAVPGLASRAGAEGALQQTPSNQLAMTWNNNRVVFGQGYENVDEAGVANPAGTYTLWATGPIAIWRDDVFVPPARQVFNRSTNQLGMIAERTYLLAYECYAATISVTFA